MEFLRAICALLFVAALISTGCTVGPDYTRYEPPVSDAWHQQLSGGVQTQPEDLSHWWERFDDPVLNWLVDHTDVNNRQLYHAVARIRSARAKREFIASSAFPTLSEFASFKTVREGAESVSTNPTGLVRQYDAWNVGLSTGWELDLFGQIARQAESAEANRVHQLENYRDLLVSLHAEVAETYVLVQTLQTQLTVAENNVAIQERALELASIRRRAGVVPKLDIHQAELNLARTRAEIPLLGKAILQALNTLDVLLGQSPGTVHELVLLTELGMPDQPVTFPESLPLDLIRQRPDIRSAERKIAENTALVGAATADLYPKFSLKGNFGLSADQFSTMFNGGSFSYSVGPSLRWALFESGRIRWNIEAQRAETEQAVADYEQKILEAMREVENALVGIEAESMRRDQLQIAVEASRAAVTDVERQYKYGKTDFQNVLDTHTILFETENELVITRGKVLLELIALYKALGGGWRRECDSTLIHNSRTTPIEDATSLNAASPIQKATPNKLSSE